MSDQIDILLTFFFLPSLCIWCTRWGYSLVILGGMIGSGILTLPLPTTSPIWDTNGFHPIFQWLICLTNIGIYSLHSLSGENILTPSGVLLLNPGLPTLHGALLSKVFPWGLGSSTLGLFIPGALSVASLSLFSTFSSFINVLRITGTRL